jgi:hypothetical protein
MMKKTKRTTKERLLLVLGLAILPFAYTLWVADRLMFTLIPQSDHKKLDDWLSNKSVIFAFTRVFTAVLITYISKWIFGF